MKLLIVVLVVVLAITACQGESDQVRGVVVSIEGGLDNVTGFELLAEDGTRLQFSVDADADFDDLPLSHLNQHRLTADPVLVAYENRGELVALSVRDG